MESTWVIITLFCLLSRVGAARLAARSANTESDTGTEFIILHNNDMHARFEQTSVNGGLCSAEEAHSNRCYGGFARVAYEVRKFRREASEGGLPVLYLNAGDTYTGTAWFTVFRSSIAIAFLNKLEPDAISLGNHEFDDNIEGLLPLLDGVNFPILACNLDLSKTPQVARTKHLANSTVFTIRGTKVGVVGYLTPETKDMTPVNDVGIKPEIESINEEAAKLKEDGVNIIIALGHSGYIKDQEIAANCPDVDVVIGGHSNTFLYNGPQPDAESIDGPYPTAVEQSSGKIVPVVQAYAYTKYLGKLHLKFDRNGKLIEFDGTPILLNASVPREDDVLQLLETYRPNITALQKVVVGHTKVFLQGNVCRFRECNLGNLVADSMVFGRVLEDLGGTFWTDAAIAFVNGGAVRSSIEKRSDGSITKTDVLQVLPFKNDLYVTRISGKTLRNALERSATVRHLDSNGPFLQMSGVQAVYDYRKPDGERVTSVKVRCSACSVPIYEPLVETKKYNVIVPKFILHGGDGHKFLEGNDSKPIRLQKNDQDTFIQYLALKNFVIAEEQGRITIIEPEETITKSGAISVNFIQLIALVPCLIVYILN